MAFLGAALFSVIAVCLLIKYDCKDMTGHDIDGHKIAEMIPIPPCSCGCGEVPRIPARRW